MKLFYSLIGVAIFFCSGQFIFAVNTIASEIHKVAVSGDDDRKEPVSPDVSAVRKKLAESTVALFAWGLNRDAVTGGYIANPMTLTDKKGLAPDQPFGKQPASASASGALVSEDLILTAGHLFLPVANGHSCAAWKVVFGYSVDKSGAAKTYFNPDDVYDCAQILALGYQDATQEVRCENNVCTDKKAAAGSPSIGADYAIIRLNRRVQGHIPLAIGRSNISKGERLFMIGHPNGLPVKITDNASVLSIAMNYFDTDLDAFSGNSGSPVFDAVTLKIVGVMTMATIDYLGGKVVAVPEESGISVVTPTSIFQSWIPVSEMEKGIDAVLSRKAARRSNKVSQLAPSVYFPGNNGTVAPAIYHPVPEPARTGGI